MTLQSANTLSINLGLEVLFGEFDSFSVETYQQSVGSRQQGSPWASPEHWSQGSPTPHQLLLLILDKWRSSRLPLGIDIEGGVY